MKNLFFTLVLSSTSLTIAPLAIGGQPNVVIILTDDQGYADISLNAQHSKEVFTPNMDALARDGVVFSQG